MWFDLIKKMISLLIKELKFTLFSLSGIIFILVYLLLCGILLWVIPGTYNIPETGYSSLFPFFSLSPVLFLLLIPALSGRSFSEEKRSGTLLLLYTRPVRLSSIIFSKIGAVYLAVLAALLPTGLYAASVYMLGNPPGNIDLSAVLGSYIGLFIILYGFVCISVFASSLTSNQVIAFILGLLFCAGFYYGFDLLSGLFSSGKVSYFIENLGFLSHYKSVQKGLVDTKDLFYVLFISGLFFLFTLLALKVRLSLTLRISYSIALLVILLLGSVFSYRIDFTKEKRYTLSRKTIELVAGIEQSLDVDLYLSGNLNPGFLRLQRSALDLLEDLSVLSSGKIKISQLDLYDTGQNQEQIAESKGIRGIAVNEKDASGKISQQIVYPWVVFKYGETELPVSILVHEQGRSGYENLESSIELLEYRFAEAILSLTRREERKIVFLHGHLELSDALTGDVRDVLSRSFRIDAGALTPRTGELDEYELVIVAGPRASFTKREKYVLDQYLMKGGKLMFFVNGAILDADRLASSGETPTLLNDINLNDMLFTYGARINPVLVEDVRSRKIPVTTGAESSGSEFAEIPWYFAPLLVPVQGHPITRNILPVKTQYASTVSLVGEEEKVTKQVLLTTSDLARTLKVPEPVSLRELNRDPDPSYFTERNLPVAVLLEGHFTSLFRNRILPDGIDAKNHSFLSESSRDSKVLVAASEEVVQNEVFESEGRIVPFPVGYDRYSGVQYGNRDFIMNAVQYMTEDEELIALRNKKFQLPLLDERKFRQNNMFYLFFNLILPILPILCMYGFVFYWRRRKYSR